MKKITIKNKTYFLPVFLPDATKGYVKAVDSNDLHSAKVDGVVVNSYYLIKLSKDIKKFMNFNGLVVSDSGGWQIFSLIQRNKKMGQIYEDGVVFSIGKNKKLFTPEDCIDVQFKLNSDIVICLDHFSPPNNTKNRVEESVVRTTEWAKRCKKRYLQNLKKYKLADKTRPLIFGVVQGAEYKDMRQKSAEELIKIGFDGYGFGGYLVDEKNEGLDMNMMHYLSNLIPDDKIKFSLGTGMPWEIAQLSKQGWDMFDCTLPTRDARHKRIYVFKKNPKSIKDLVNKDNYEFLYLNKNKFANDDMPLDKYCDCPVCKTYSRSYIHYLFKQKDILALRLATIHNLRHFTKVIEILRKN